MINRRIVWCFFTFIFCGHLCGCPTSQQDDLPIRQTQVQGFAPLNRGGVAKVTLFSDADLQKRSPGKFLGGAFISTDGKFVVDLENFSGDFAIEAIGGQYEDPEDGHTISMTDDSMHAVVYSVNPGEIANVAITPWSELLYQHAWLNYGLDKHEAARIALEKSLGCVDRNLVTAHPLVPSDAAPLESTNNGELAYIYLAGLNKLARSVGQELSLDDKVVPLARLICAIGTALRISGKIEQPIEVVPRKFIQPDILRQPFAQAIRAYLDRNRRDVKLNTKSVANLLECISSGGADMWGPLGEKIDLKPPEITMESSAIIGGPIELTCVANDPSGIAGMSISATQAGRVFSGVPTFASEKLVGQGQPEARLIVTFNPTQMMTGDVTVQCSAEDRWGNSHSEESRYGVNRGGATVQTSIDPFENRDGKIYVEKVSTVSCRCTDRYPETEKSCGLDDTSAALPGMQPLIVDVPGTVRYEWDTRKSLDGEKTLNCQARSVGLTTPISDPRKVHVGNFAPMKLKGRVELDTAVRGMTVRAWAFRANGDKGALLGEAEAPEGAFSLTITNEYTGPILIEATPSQAENAERTYFVSLATGFDVTVRDGQRLALLWDNYTPARQLPTMSVNGATTIATDYAQALITQGDDATDAILKGLLFIKKHIQPDGSLDPRTTSVGDMSIRNGGFENDVLLGLFHVGMSRLAAAKGGGRDRFATLNLLKAIEEDLGGGATLNGKDKDDNPVPLGGIAGGQYLLSADTLRLDLAHATRHWLENADLHGEPAVFSKIDQPRQFSRPRQYLRWLTTNNASVFGDAPVKEFDTMAPELGVRIRSGRRPWVDAADGDRMRGVVEIRVDATDDTDVRTLSIRIAGEEEQPHCVMLRGIGDTAAFGEYTWNSQSDEGNRTVTLEIIAADSLGNGSNAPQRYDISIDNSPPEIAAPAVIRSNSGAVILSGRVSKPYASLRVTQDGALIASQEGVEDTEQEGEQEYSFDLNLPCNATHHLMITAEDEAGNRSISAPSKIICDTFAPKVIWVPSKHEQEYDGQSVEIKEGVWLQKHVHRLGAEDSNLPEIAWYVNDRSETQAGSLMEDIIVEYAISFRSAGQVRSTEWSRVQPQEGNQFPSKGYSVKLSYETMLPKNIRELDVRALRAANYVASAGIKDEFVLLVKATDEFQNETVERFPFYLDVRSAPVRISCARANIATLKSSEALSLEQVVQSSAVGRSNLVATVEWSASDGEGISELAPSLDDALLTVRMPDVTQKTVVERTTKQLRLLARYAPMFDLQEGWWCDDRGERWARAWSDGECEPHTPDSVSNTWQTFDKASFVQVHQPVERTVVIHGRRRESVAYQTQTHTPLQIEMDSNGRRRLQYQYRTAVEYERRGGWGRADRAWLDERRFVDYAVILTVVPVATALANSYPQPSKVEIDSSCHVARFFRDQS